MEKVLKIIFTLVFVANQVYPQVNADEKNQANLAAQHVSKQISYKHKYVNDQPVENGVKMSETTFDKEGRVLTSINYFEKNGEIKTQESYNYNHLGQKITYIKIKDGKVKFKRLYRYEGENLVNESGLNGGEKYENAYSYSNGKLSSISYHMSGILSEIREFSYAGKVTTVEVKTAAGQVKSKIRITVDDNDRVIEEVNFDYSGNQIDKKTYTYNALGKITEEAKYGADNQLFYKNFYEYNADGYVLKFLEQSSDEPKFEKKLYKYDGNNNLIKLQWRRNATEEYNEMTYTYNEKGLRTSVVTYSPAYNFKLMSKYRYEFR